LSYERRRDRGR